MTLAVLDARQGPLALISFGENTALAAAQAAAALETAQSIRTETLNLWPDPFFGASGGDLDATMGGRDLYSSAFPNMVWDADYVHAFGQGAWIIASSSAAAGGALLWFDGKGVAEGDSVILAVRLNAPAGTNVTMTGRFIDDAGAYVGVQFPSLNIVATGEDQLVVHDPATVPAGVAGVAVYVLDGATAGDIALFDVLGAKGDSIEALANIEAGQAGVAGTARGAAESSAEALAGVASNQSEYRARLALVEAGKDVIETTIGTAAPINTSTLSATYSYLIDVPATYDGYLQRLVVYGRIAGVVKVKRFKLVGGDYVFQNEVSVPFGTGSQDLSAWLDFAGFEFEAGDYLGLRVVSGQLSVTVGAANNTPYYQVTGDMTTSFTPGTRFTANRIEVGFVTKQGAPRSDPETAPPAYSQRLRRFRAFAMAHALGATGNRYALGLFGDSWSTSSSYYVANFANLMVDRYGDGGVGWCGFGYTGGAPFADARGLYTVTLSGTWTTNYHAGSTSPNVSDVRSSQTGASITIANAEGATHPAFSGIELHFTGTAAGVIRWRWNGGAWSSNTNVQGTLNAQQVLALTGFPTGALAEATVGTTTLEIEVVSGSVVLGGLDLQSDTDGIVIHKLGSSGSKASDWLTSTEAQFEAGIALLGIDGAQILFGTNEDSNGQSAATVAASYDALAGRLLDACPACDLMLCVAPENGLDNENDMTLYAAAVAALTAGASPEVFAAFCDLQPAFGDPANKDEYLYGGSAALFNVSDSHPNDRGALVVARELSLMWTGGAA